LRFTVVDTLTYMGIVLLLRIMGKRYLLSMNAFDFIITVAMGSAFERILLLYPIAACSSPHSPIS
jgi:uncharacterized membrane protein YcaP (DUF421 family)